MRGACGRAGGPAAVLARARPALDRCRRLTPGRGLTTGRMNKLRSPMGSVIKKRRKRMDKKKQRKLLRKTRHQRRNKK